MVPCAAPRGGAERDAHPKPAWPWAHKRFPFLLLVLLSLDPADGKPSHYCGHHAGRSEAGSSRGVVQRAVGGGLLECTPECLLCSSVPTGAVPGGVPVSVINTALQNKFRNDRSEGVYEGRHSERLC